MAEALGNYYAEIFVFSIYETDAFLKPGKAAVHTHSAKVQL